MAAFPGGAGVLLQQRGGQARTREDIRGIFFTYFIVELSSGSHPILPHCSIVHVRNKVNNALKLIVIGLNPFSYFLKLYKERLRTCSKICSPCW